MMDAQIRITEQELEGTVFFHWQILREDGSVFATSAYHTNRDTCVKEANGTIAYYRSQDWL